MARPERFELPAFWFPPRRTLRALAKDSSWVRQHENIFVLGPTGVGKSFIASALAQKACRDGYSALYLRAAALLRELALARADGSLRNFLARLGRIDVLVIYDWAMAPLNENERREATVLPNPTRVYHKSPYPQCSAPTVLLSANLYARSTVDTALWISHHHPRIGEK